MLSYCSPNEGSGAATEGLLAKRPLVGPLPLLRLLVESSKSPLREAALALDASEAAGGAGGLVSLLRFFPNFFFPVVVVVVVAVILRPFGGLLGSEAADRFNEVIIGREMLIADDRNEVRQEMNLRESRYEIYGLSTTKLMPSLFLQVKIQQLTPPPHKHEVVACGATTFSAA